MPHLSIYDVFYTILDHNFYLPNPPAGEKSFAEQMNFLGLRLGGVAGTM